ncbi:MAG TPA: RDD family protein [Rhodocyclaceae bacterium]|nr:RDD family protein [Rhodocyclaceae bacterium]
MTVEQRPVIRRLLASLFYEALVVFSLLMVGFWIPQTVLAPILLSLDKANYQRLLMLHIFILLLVYFVWFWLNGGQTLSMKTWRLRLISSDGYRLRPAQALLRYLAAWPSVLLLVGILWAFFDRDRRFLHDRIAGTRIIAVD